MPTSEYGTSTQVIVVTAPSYGATSEATLTAYQRGAAGWVVAFGPMAAQIGWDGFQSPMVTRIEGNGTTPSGSFGFGTFFGADPNPGGLAPYVYSPTTDPALSTSWCWNEDVTSSQYNSLQPCSNIPNLSNTNSFEYLDTVPAYNYGVVIDFNTSNPVPGVGSGIFLHVTPGPTTNGCVAISQSALVGILRWMNPAMHPVIVMGVTSEVLNGFR